MNNPLVSICIPTYNGEEYLRESLTSAISQTYDNIEIVVVDDRSSDNTVSIVKEFQQKDKRIKLFENAQNLGLVGNWNRCLDVAEGEWIKFLFQDDYIAINAISRMMEYANDTNKFIVCDRQLLFENGVSKEVRNLYSTFSVNLSVLFKSNKEQYIPAKTICNYITVWKQVNYIGEPTVTLFKRTLVKEIGYFNSAIAQICDLEFWYRLSSANGLFYIPERLSNFRIHDKATSSRNRERKINLLDTAIILHSVCFANEYHRFRQQISFSQLNWLKINFAFQYRVLTHYLNKSRDAEMESSSADFIKNVKLLPLIKYSALIYYILLPIVKLRRLIRK